MRACALFVVLSLSSGSGFTAWTRTRHALATRLFREDADYASYRLDERDAGGELVPLFPLSVPLLPLARRTTRLSASELDALADHDEVAVVICADAKTNRLATTATLSRSCLSAVAPARASRP